MCGIAGIFQTDGAPVGEAILTRMTQALAHRGPDGSGVWINGNIGLGHRRLAIRDLSSAGHQPMADSSNAIIVSFNGEIYNDQHLRQKITATTGYQFRTKCDTEVIPAGFLAWGEDIFSHLEGMFAIAIWDRREERLILARDGIGIKPLFVSKIGRSIRFASEIKALLALDDQPNTLSTQALHHYLAQGYTSPDDTLLEDVWQIKPGTYHVFDKNNCYQKTYWRPIRTGEITNMCDALDEMEHIFPKVLDDMLLSDVPVSLLQSSGIDSSLISYFLRDHKNLMSYTVQFQSSDHDETHIAKQVSDACGHHHNIVPISAGSEDTISVFHKIVHHLDGQLADSSALAFYKLTKAISQQAKVILSGDGADEFFAGYSTYKATKYADKLRHGLPSPVWRYLGKYLSSLSPASNARISFFDKMARLTQGLGHSIGSGSEHAQWRRLLPAHLVQPLYANEMKEKMQQPPLSVYEDYMVNGTTSNIIDNALIADQSHYLAADMLRKVDAMSMAHSVEVRVPFLDKRIMEFAGKLHTSLLCPDFGKNKKVLRQLLLNKGAPKILTQNTKKGFNIPIASLLRGELRPLCENVFIKDVERFGQFFHPEIIMSLWDEHHNGKVNHSYTLWTLLTFGVWLGQINK